MGPVSELSMSSLTRPLSGRAELPCTRSREPRARSTHPQALPLDICASNTAGPANRAAARASLRRGARGDERVVVEHRREPFLRFGDGPALARGIVLDLVALDLADAEIVAVGMAEIEPADRRARPHGEALGEPDPDAALGVEQREQRRLLAVVGLRRITWRRADAAILLGDEVGAAERFVRSIGPEFLAHALVQAL